MDYNYSVAGTGFGADERGKVTVPPTIKSKKGIKSISIQEFEKNQSEFLLIKAENQVEKEEEK